MFYNDDEGSGLMKSVSTLKFYVWLLFPLIVFVCINTIPNISRALTNDEPVLFFAFIVLLELSVIAFVVALYSAYRILDNIQNGQHFTNDTLKRLKTIKYSSDSFGIIFAIIALLYLIFLRTKFSFIPIFAAFSFLSVIVSYFAEVLLEIFKNGMELKHDSELTI